MTRSVLVFFLSYFTLSSTYLLNNVNKQGIGAPGGAEFYDVYLPEEKLFSQKLDHFDPTNENTWSQRYWTNSSFYKPGGPVFLMINGEAAASAKWATIGQWISYAEENDALCFLVEHRFYGGSRPVNDTSSVNLKYLSSEQALADLAYFIEGMNEKYRFTAETKWIVFGGSYAGSLAAWLRMKYPHLVHGAVSSSGPLLAKIDFNEYFQVVKAALASYKKDCVAEVAAANLDLARLVSSESGRLEIMKKFKLCDDLQNNQDDIANLFENLAGNFADVVQYNKDNRDSSTSNITIETVCDIMIGKTSKPRNTPLDRYATVNELSLLANNITCLSHKYEKYIHNLQKTDWESASENGRQWLYQTCTEFGFYQTSSKDTDLFGKYFPVDFFTKQCEEIFGIKFDVQLLEDGVHRTNILYGALNINVGNIIFVHGSVDPWHALGLLRTTPDKRYETIFINGTAHCADMYPSSPKDSILLRQARKKIQSVIKSWLSSDIITIILPSRKPTVKLIVDMKSEKVLSDSPIYSV